jgi:hypothetical protein
MVFELKGHPAEDGAILRLEKDVTQFDNQYCLRREILPILNTNSELVYYFV